MKTCVKCSSEFDGRRCLNCQRAYQLTWNPANREKIRAASEKYRKNNREKTNAAVARWAAENPDRVKQKNKDYVEANPEKRKESARSWARKNPEALKLHKHTRRARERNAVGTLSSGLSERLFRAQRGKCPCCHQPLGDDYHLDHRVPLALGGSNTDENMQLLRAVCNKQKGAKHPVDFMQQRGFLL